LRVGLVSVCALLLGVATAGAEGDQAGGGANDPDEIRVRPDPEPQARPEGDSPGLDSLLQLPSDFMATEAPEVAGASESEWRRRFRKTTDELELARTELEETKTELDGVAEGGGSSQWSVAPPGGSAEPADSPLSFKLRQELKRNRERVEQAEKALRELRIQADLAGVPASWRGRELPPQRSLAY